jgi:hypothetical protein
MDDRDCPVRRPVHLFVQLGCLGIKEPEVRVGNVSFPTLIRLWPINRRWGPPRKPGTRHFDSLACLKTEQFGPFQLRILL